MSKLLASSNTEEGILKAITDFYCGSTISIHGEDVHNSKGKILGVRVVRKKNRFRFELQEG